jgi:hypothetical protein
MRERWGKVVFEEVSKWSWSCVKVPRVPGRLGRRIVQRRKRRVKTKDMTRETFWDISDQ